jgi:hypothetical protein
MKIFASGSCRLLTVITNGHDIVVPIHSMYHNFCGINFLGKLHNTKQHIQFLQYIMDDITIPRDILASFLTSYSSWDNIEDTSLIPDKKEAIKRQFLECDWYFFEICSIKRYIRKGFDVQHEHTKTYECVIQTDKEIYDDLRTLRELIPANKKILFQCHFRPNIIFTDTTKAIDKRETIYAILKDFCDKNENTFLYDPSILLQTNHALFDGETHFIYNGFYESFMYIYNNYLLVEDTNTTAK